ncbi:hypothetical protein [Pricia sp.]|uniref:GH39 family glycosyl hydrolase n=1 Tax=Pricia sp. TaxID=2268138 RepID=UPI003593E54E
MKQIIFPILLTLFIVFQSSGQEMEIPFPNIGTIKPRNASQIESSNWIIGCETLDRDYADYDAYKEYLVPLGIKRLRIQTGWAKTEKEKGKYDWAWLDHILNDAAERGLQPWLQLSYGNTIYNGGGGINLAGGIPTSKEALQAWDNWVAAMVTRYKDKVVEWEVWNEPNFGNLEKMANGPDLTADLNIRTVDIIKKIQPEARVSGLAMGHIDLDFADTFFKILAEKGKLELFDNMVYHDYVYNPDSNYPKVQQLRDILDKYDPSIPLRQGENGAPSLKGEGRGAIGNHDWTELSQSKWDTRRMLGDLGHDIQSSVFTIIDIAYTAGPITKLNVKGLIESDSTKRAIRPKMAYYAVQNVASIFDNSLERIKNLEQAKDSLAEGSDAYTQSTATPLSVYGYKNKKNGRSIYTIWTNGDIPSNATEKENVDFTFSNASFEQPVYVDVITGDVRKITASQWSKSGNKDVFKNIPIYDGPIVIADQSLIHINQIK